MVCAIFIQQLQFHLFPQYLSILVQLGETKELTLETESASLLSEALMRILSYRS